MPGTVRADAQVSAGSQLQPGVTGLTEDQRVDPPAAFTSSVWGIHDTQDPLLPIEEQIPTGCGYYRITLPLDQLARHGWKIKYQPGRPPPEAGLAKLIVGERLDRPEVMGEWRRLRLNHRLVYELDDDVWSVDPTNAGAWMTYSKWDVQDAVAMCCRVADIVTVSTEPLAEVIRERTGQERIRVLKNCIPERLLSMERKRPGQVTMGWTGGGSHTRDMAMVAVPLRRAMDREPKLRLHIVGTDFRHTLGHTNTRHTPWLKSRDWMGYYSALDFDFGIAPIVSSKFNESKSYLKPLEYAALGIPCIASDWGPYREFIQDGVTGFLVSKPGQWTDRIRLLANDAKLRESMGQKAREVAAQHTIEGNWHRWAAVYEEVLR